MTGEIIPPKSKKELEELALTHDAKLVYSVKEMKASIDTLGSELSIMRNEDMKLYRFIKDPSFNGFFNNWRDYARYRLGPISTAKLYDLINAHSLTCGPQAISKDEVEELGLKKAAQLARVPEKKRTRKLVNEAKKITTKKLKQKVDKIVEDEKPASERKELLIPLTIALPQRTIDVINEIEKDGAFMEGIRDGDTTLTLRAKLWHAVWCHFRECYSAELAEGREARELHERSESPTLQ